MAQPVHSSPFPKTAVEYPLAFISDDMEIIFWGQKEMQSAQPLQNSREISIFPFISPSPLGLNLSGTLYHPGKRGSRNFFLFPLGILPAA
jgi:hypothetical protein